MLRFNVYCGCKIYSASFGANKKQKYELEDDFSS